MKTFDDIQRDFTEIIKDYMRRELGKDFYAGKIQALVVTTNTVTGTINIDTCNVNLTGDAKKMLREALEQLERSQMANALRSLIRREMEFYENDLRQCTSAGNKGKKCGRGCGKSKKVPRQRRGTKRRAR